MAEDEFTKLFKYMQTVSNNVDTLLEESVTKSEFHTFVNAFDTHAKQTETTAVLASDFN